MASDNIGVHRCPSVVLLLQVRKMAQKVLLLSSVKVTGKTMEQQPLFDQRVWITPMILAIAGIAAALCTLLIR
jgi:hypothetical protein